MVIIVNTLTRSDTDVREIGHGCPPAILLITFFILISSFLLLGLKYLSLSLGREYINFKTVEVV